MQTEDQHAKRRYPGARPFEEEEQHLFFGREEDVEALFNLLFVEKVVTLYGQSGIGKSSLIMAGLIPRLMEEYQKSERGKAQPVFHPVVFRFGDYKGAVERGSRTKEPVDIFKHIFKQKFDSNAGNFFKDLIESDDKLRLWHLLKSFQLAGKKKPVPVIILDQFEELFTHPQKSISRFRNQLAELLMTQVPQDLRDRLGELQDGEAKLGQLLQNQLEFKILIGIRSDKFNLINRLKLPMLTQKAFEIQGLTQVQANRAMVLPAKYPLDSPPYSSVFTFEKKSKEIILDYLTKSGENEVEAFQMQILCYYFEEKVFNEGLRKVAVKSEDELDEIYANFYDYQLEEHLKDEGQRQAARDLIEEELIFEKGKRRTRSFGSQLKERYNVDQELLDILVNKTRIIREIPEENYVIYEVSHDSLVEPILRSRAARKKEEERQNKEEAKRKAKQLEERNKSMKATEEFLLGEIENIEPMSLRKKVRETVLDKFVDEEQKVRHVIEKTTLLQQYGWTREVLEDFLSIGLLEEIAGSEATFFKLSDDQLMEAVLNIKARQKAPLKESTKSKPSAPIKSKPFEWERKTQIPSSGTRAHSQFEWDYLLDSIKEQKCILVLGNSFPAFEDGSVVREALPRFLDVGNNPDIVSYNHLERLFQFEAVSARTKIFYKIKQFYRQQKAHPIYNKLALMPFSLFLSTSPDKFLSEAFEELRMPYQYNHYSKYRPSEQDHRMRIDNPLIFNLLGSLEDQQSLNLTFHDFAEYLESIYQGKGLGLGLKDKLLDSDTFIFLDFDFTPYSLLLLWLLFGKRFKDSMQFSINREPVAPNLRTDISYLFNINFTEMGTEEFIETLFQRLEANNMLKVPDNSSKLEEIRIKIKDCIAAGHMDKALDLLEEIRKSDILDKSQQMQAIRLQGRWATLKENFMLGILRHEEKVMQQNKIVQHLLEFIDSLNI